MKKRLVLIVAVLALLITSCTKVQPPHVVAKCKLKFDACMVKHTLDGPLKAHKICMRKRSSQCR